LTRGARKTSASGFVNGVLRSTLRQHHKLPLPSRPTNLNDRASALAYLGVTHSHPDWLVSRWLDRYGFEATEQWVQFNNATPLLTLRVNRLRATREEAMAALAVDDVETEPTRFAPDGLLVTRGNPLRRPADGLVFVQDEASQLVALLGAPRAGESILDTCASPGGKTTAMAAEAGDKARIVAADVRDARMQLLRETVTSSGARSVHLVQADLERGLPFAAAFDLVFVETSGVGGTHPALVEAMGQKRYGLRPVVGKGRMWQGWQSRSRSDGTCLLGSD
jgi:16S rRNA (cytosine967-C5)-methyltransferase